MIQDSGARREFPSGAVRDIDDGKGRCDLLPLVDVGELLGSLPLTLLGEYVKTGDTAILDEAINSAAEHLFGNKCTAMLEVAIHYADGAKKYAERNWERGINCHCYVDSAVRHYIKYLRGDTDERHDRAALWNLLGLRWTLTNKPELNDLPFNVQAEPSAEQGSGVSSYNTTPICVHIPGVKV